MRRAGDKEANAHFKTAVTLNEELLTARPNDNAQKIQSAQAYVNLCRVLPKGLAAGESVETCRRALPLLQAVYSDTALQIQQGILENAQKESAADGENAQARQDVASTLSQIGLTYTARKDFPSALTHFKKALRQLEQLIAKDAANSEIQQDYFNNYIYAGDAQGEQRDYESAVKTYRAAFEFAQNAPKLKDSPFVRFAEGMMHEKIGSCLMSEAENTPPNPERRRKFQTAREEFQKALLNWQDKESAPDKFGLSEELVATAQKKSAECEEKAAL